ncbi:unnamed protein product, partial [Brassica rapa subsp. trilocularis]
IILIKTGSIPISSSLSSLLPLLFLNLLPFLFYSDKLNPGLIKSSHQTSSPKVSQIGHREIEIGAILRWCISELQNRRLYIKQATSATSVTDKEEEEAEWVEYKIKRNQYVHCRQVSTVVCRLDFSPRREPFH